MCFIQEAHSSYIISPLFIQGRKFYFFLSFFFVLAFQFLLNRIFIHFFLFLISCYPNTRFIIVYDVLPILRSFIAPSFDLQLNCLITLSPIKWIIIIGLNKIGFVDGVSINTPRKNKQSNNKCCVNYCRHFHMISVICIGYSTRSVH